MDADEQRLLEEYNENQRRVIAWNERRLEIVGRVCVLFVLTWAAVVVLVMGVYGLSRLDLEWSRGLFALAMPLSGFGLVYAAEVESKGRPERMWIGLAITLLSAFVIGVTWPRF